jgi:dUTP pyrophosphatase
MSICVCKNKEKEKEKDFIKCVYLNTSYKYPVIKGHEGDLGWDIPLNNDKVILPSMKVTPVHSGISLKSPCGFGLIVKDRSSIALKGVFTVAGVIDEGYTGELVIAFFNSNSEDFVFDCGDRIAQVLLHPVFNNDVMYVSSLNNTSRNDNGFGSTGV